MFIGWNCVWMKVSKLDESVLDESVIGWNRFWMKVYSTVFFLVVLSLASLTNYGANRSWVLFSDFERIVESVSLDSTWELFREDLRTDCVSLRPRVNEHLSHVLFLCQRLWIWPLWEWLGSAWTNFREILSTDRGHLSSPSDSSFVRVCLRASRRRSDLMYTYTHLLHAHFSAHSALTAYFAHLHTCAHTRMTHVLAKRSLHECHLSPTRLLPSQIHLSPTPDYDFTDDSVHTFLSHLSVPKA